MFGRLGWTEILIIVVLVIILFGHNKIPGMMKNLANGLNVFKKELKDTKKQSDKKSVKTDKPKQAAAKKKTTKKK